MPINNKLEDFWKSEIYQNIEKIFNEENRVREDSLNSVKDVVNNLKDEDVKKFEAGVSVIFDNALKYKNLKILEFLVLDADTEKIVRKHVDYKKYCEIAINEKKFKLAKMLFQFELDDKYQEIVNAQKNMTVKLDEKFLKNLKTIAKETYYKEKDKNGKRDSSKDKKDRLDYLENKIKEFKKIREKATNKELETFLNSIYGIFKEIDKPKEEIRIG